MKIRTARRLAVAAIFAFPALVFAQAGAHIGPRADRVPSALPPPLPAPAMIAEPRTENGVTWMCGGVGQDEAERLRQASRDYGLMLTFAARNGSYLADVQVEIADARGKTLVKTGCGGPIMLVNPPKDGEYRIRAEAGGYTLTRRATLARKGDTQTLVLAWPEPAVGLEPRESMSGSSAAAGSDEGSAGAEVDAPSGSKEPKNKKNGG